MGVPGPGGPCSEILYDRGPEYGPEADFAHWNRLDMPTEIEDRYLEFWNLVFMQEVLSAVRSKDDFDIAGPLPKRNIDTGMGLERVAFLLQGKQNMYEIDTMFPVIEKAEELTGRRYGADHQDDVRFRVVADHVRSSMMLDRRRGHPRQRGPRLRPAPAAAPCRPLDAAARHRGPRAARAVPGQPRPDVARPTRRSRRTGSGSPPWPTPRRTRSGRRCAPAPRSSTWPPPRSPRAVAGRSPGDKAFALHDTYGFPIDLTLEMASEKGLSVDEDGFRRLMGEQRDRAKADAKAKKSQHADAGAYREIADAMGRPVQFTGYDEVVSEGVGARHRRRRRHQRRCGARGRRGRARARPHAVLRRGRRPARRPGRDRARQRRPGRGRRRAVADHRRWSCTSARVLAGEVQVGAAGAAPRRRGAAALDQPLAHRDPHGAQGVPRGARRHRDPGRVGERARAASGSTSPPPARCREAAMADVEARVNDLVLADLAVHAEVMTQAEAVKSGAMALFGEKYGDEVRVISVGDWARELCGGTHAGSSGQLGVVKLLGESSIGSGVRRVEALVGGDAYRFLAREHVLVAQLSEAAEGAPRAAARAGRRTSLDRLRAAEKEIEKVRVGQLLAGGAALADGAEDVHGVSFVGQRVDGAGGGDVRTLALDVRGRLPRRPARRGGGRRRQGRQAGGRGGHQRGRPWARPERQHPGPGRVRRARRLRAAARTTSPRAAAPTRPASTGRSPRSATGWREHRRRT